MSFQSYDKNSEGELCEDCRHTLRNIRDPKIAARLPPYFTAAFPQNASFIVLPIVSGDSPIACILVGRDVPETGPISSEDIGLLRAVRGQIIWP
jgi:hypothetical protein